MGEVVLPARSKSKRTSGSDTKQKSQRNGIQTIVV